MPEKESVYAQGVRTMSDKITAINRWLNEPMPYWLCILSGFIAIQLDRLLR